MYKITKKEMVDTISIPIMNLSKSVTLMHKVRLSKPDVENRREYYHKEFSYASKFSDLKTISTLRLTHSSILTIEDRTDDNYESLVINTTNRDFIVKSLSKCKKLLKTPELFIESDSVGIIINPKLKSKIIIPFEAYKGKTIVVKPCVITPENSDSIAGVGLCLNPKSLSFIEIPADTFKTMLKIIKKFDFHQAGLLAVTYLQSSDIGNHEFSFSKSLNNDFDIDTSSISNLDKSSNGETSLNSISTKKFYDPTTKGW